MFEFSGVDGLKYFVLFLIKKNLFIFTFSRLLKRGSQSQTLAGRFNHAARFHGSLLPFLHRQGTHLGQFMDYKTFCLFKKK